MADAFLAGTAGAVVLRDEWHQARERAHDEQLGAPLAGTARRSPVVNDRLVVRAPAELLDDVEHVGVGHYPDGGIPRLHHDPPNAVLAHQHRHGLQ